MPLLEVCEPAGDGHVGEPPPGLVEVHHVRRDALEARIAGSEINFLVPIIIKVTAIAAHRLGMMDEVHLAADVSEPARAIAAIENVGFAWSEVGGQLGVEEIGGH